MKKKYTINSTEVEMEESVYDHIYGQGREKGFSVGSEKSNERFADGLKTFLGEEISKGMKTSDITKLVTDKFDELNKKLEKEPNGEEGKKNEIDVKLEIAKGIEVAQKTLKEGQDKLTIRSFKDEIKANAIRMNLGKDSHGVFPAYVEQHFNLKITENGNVVAMDNEEKPFLVDGQEATPEDIAKFVKTNHSSIFPQMKSGANLGPSGDSTRSEEIDLSKSAETLIADGLKEIQTAGV